MFPRGGVFGLGVNVAAFNAREHLGDNMERRAFLKLAAVSPALVSPVYAGCAAGSPDGDASGTVIGAPSLDPQTGFTFYSPLAEEWYRSGEYFEWTSTTRNNEGRQVSVFYRTFGSRANPALVMLHGYPNSSFDFRALIPLLEEDYFVAVLDFPGFGFSDKPQDGYSYMIEDDAKLVDHFVREIVGLSRFHLLTHSRGGSVGFSLLGDYLAREANDYEITYHFISGSGFLPLVNFGPGQMDVLHAERGPEVIRERQARPRVTQGTPEQIARADIQAFNDGIGAQLYVGKYQLERVANEYRWLDNLRESPIPTALIWGLQDTVNPPRIANYIWSNYLDKRSVESSYWLLPTVDHYPHREEPEEMAGIIRACLEDGIPAPEDENAFMRARARNRTATSPVYVGRSIIEDVVFPGSVVYSPEGYSF